jgi:hypothetical protein
MDLSEAERQELLRLESSLEREDPFLAQQLCSAVPRLFRAGRTMSMLLFWTALLAVALGPALRNYTLILAGLITFIVWPVPMLVLCHSRIHRIR